MNKTRTTSLPAIKLLQSQSLPGLVQQELERLILAGQLPPGSQLTEIPLAERLGVGEIATTDRRHFTGVRPRHVDHLRLLPEVLG